MSCKFNDFDGKCILWDETDIQMDHIVNSCDHHGHCLVDEDVYPFDSCEDYEER